MDDGSMKPAPDLPKTVYFAGLEFPIEDLAALYFTPGYGTESLRHLAEAAQAVSQMRGGVRQAMLTAAFQSVDIAPPRLLSNRRTTVTPEK
jgi:hypothetical protein